MTFFVSMWSCKIRLDLVDVFYSVKHSSWSLIGFTTGLPRVQFSNTIPLPVNTITVVGEGMTPYMFGYSVIPKNIKLLCCPSLCQPHSVTGCVPAGCYDSFHAQSQTRPKPAQPQTDPRRFIMDAPRVVSCHVTHSHHVHPQTRVNASWYAWHLVVRAASLPAL